MKSTRFLPLVITGLVNLQQLGPCTELLQFHQAGRENHAQRTAARGYVRARTTRSMSVNVCHRHRSFQNTRTT